MLKITISLLFLMLAPGAWAGTLFSENWDGKPVGTLPYPWLLATSNSTTSATLWAFELGPARVLRFADDNGDTLNNTLYTSFAAQTQGTVTYQFDVMFPSIHAGYGMRITNGGVPTTGTNWLAAVKFEGDVPYATGALAGDISYQEYTSGTNAYTRTNPVATYAANTWYTVQIKADLDTKTYQIYFGPQGGTLNRITPSAGVPFIKTTAGGQASTAGGITVYSSNKLEPAGICYYDNITVSSNIEYPATIAEARDLPNGSKALIADKVVSAGTDQLKTPAFFYIQDATGGMRVRSSTVVRQGDKVTVFGTIQRASDNGVTVLRNGERELNATSVTVTYGPFAMPAAVEMTNRAIGGGPSTAMDPDGYPCQPGVWAASNGATSGYDQISETGPNNVGSLGVFSGTVVYADDANRFFYINDGSNVQDGAALADGSTPPPGVRVLAPPGVPLNGIVGKRARITGVVGSVSQAEVGSPAGPGGNYIRNVRVIRPTSEPFMDLNLNGYWDPGEPYVDTNANGAWDGLRIYGVPGSTATSGFDRYGTLIYKGAPFLPKGIYIYDLATSTLDTMVSQGFNTVIDFDALTTSDLPNIDARGLKTMPCLRDPASRPTWMAAKDSNAILGWYVHDEPEGQGVSVSQALTDYQWVKAQDPGHVAGCSHFLYNAFYDYSASEEFTFSDSYPVLSSTSSLMPIVDIMWAIHAAHGSLYYPGYQFIQLFQGGSQVLPTPQQVRAILYAAMAFNAKGFFYFSYQHPDNPLWPLDWAEVKTLNSELDLFKPFLVLPWTPVDATTSTDYVRIGGFRVGNSALIVTVNVTASTQTATFNLPGIPADTLTLPLEGGATQALTNHSFTYTYQPYQVRVLLWGNIPSYTLPTTFSTTGSFVKANRWNCVSLPADPADADPLVAFGALDVPNVSFQYWRSTVDGGGFQSYGNLFGWTGPLVRGTPYWFLQGASNTDLSFVGTNPTSDFQLTIPAHTSAPYWVMFGAPFPNAVLTDSIRLKNVSKRGDTWLTWADAYSQGNPSLRIVDSNAQGWSAATNSFVTVTPSLWPGVHQFDPWWGYWMLVYDPGELQIKFPKP